jgi:hypothetical protein
MKYTNELKYPTTYDIEQALLLCNKGFVERFAKSKGLFLFRSTKEDIASGIAQLFLEQGDLEKIREAAFSTSVSSSTSGFVVSAPDEIQFDPVAKIQRSILDAEISRDGEVAWVEAGTEAGSYNGELRYTAVKAGKIELLQNEERSVKFTISELEGRGFQVYVEADSSADASRFEKVILKTLGPDIREERLDFESLSAAQSISFFDDLYALGLGKEWRAIRVDRLIFRRPDVAEGEGLEITAEPLAGINRAIFEGANLRDNDLVKRLEADGYKVSAMTIRFEHKVSGHLIDIKVEFKLRPDIFEITIGKYTSPEKKDDNIVYSDHHLTAAEREAFRRSVWNNAKSIYDTIFASGSARKTKKPKKRKKAESSETISVT